MPGHKFERITEDIRRELTSIFRELKDPRVTQSMISIVKVDVSKDLSFCKVYISAMGGLEIAKEAVLGLKSAAGFIRHELGERLNLRNTPAPIFFATDSIEYGADLFKKLDKLKDS